MVGGPQIRNIGTIGGNTCHWRYLRRLRLHPPRVGGHSRAHRGSERKRLLPIRDFYIKAGLALGRTPGRDTDRRE